MTFQISNISNGQSEAAGLVLYLSWTVTIQKYFGLSVFFFKKFDLFKLIK